MTLPPDIRVFERGWLSSNNILLLGGKDAALVDSGYATHSGQTVGLVAHALDGQPLRTLVNTHLHSDHCGGNAALQARYPGLRTLIPPGQAEAVRRWDETTLTYAPTGQLCPRFAFDDLLHPDTEVELGARRWQVHAAPGHDPHSLILFQPDLRLLVSADALWENGFGVVFPELEGVSAFAEVGATLDLIESLRPALVIPGHGAPFADVAGALERARRRLAQFSTEPPRHARYAAKVLFKFKLLEQQRMAQAELLRWAEATPYLRQLHQTHGDGLEMRVWLQELLADLLRSDAAQLQDSPSGPLVLNA